MNGVSLRDVGYLRERGFDAAGTSFRKESDGQWLALTHVCAAPLTPGAPWYWTAVATSKDPDRAMELVVSASEGIDSVITAYVTAEVRTWRRT